MVASENRDLGDRSAPNFSSGIAATLDLEKLTVLSVASARYLSPPFGGVAEFDLI